MILKLNNRYDVPGGYIVPRSHFKADAGSYWAVFQITDIDGDRYTTYHSTLSKGDLRKLLPTRKREKIEII